MGVMADYLYAEGIKTPSVLSLGFPSAVDKFLRVLINTPSIPSLDGVLPALCFWIETWSCYTRMLCGHFPFPSRA